MSAGGAMRVLALVTQKGGTGKSSLAVSLAVAAVERGMKVALIDIDPQGTALAWSGRREAPSPRVEATGADGLDARLASLTREGFDLAVVDTPGSAGGTADAAIRGAHLSLLPARPSVADIEAVRPTIRALAAGGAPFAFVLNQCPAGARARVENAARALRLISPVAEPALALRADHMDALACGLGVTEHAPSGKAAAEIRALLDWVLARLESGPGRADHHSSDSKSGNRSV